MLPALTLGLALILPQQGGQENGEMEFTVDRLHVGDGNVIENATVTIRDGKIVSVSGGGEGEEQDGPMTVMTPGLVDAFSFMGIDGRTLEESRETTPSLQVATSLDLDAAAFRQAAANGVTSAFLSPDSMNVFGGLGAFVKTSGGASADLFADAGSAARIVESAAGLKISLGSDPDRGNFAPRGQFNHFLPLAAGRTPAWARSGVVPPRLLSRAQLPQGQGGRRGRVRCRHGSPGRRPRGRGAGALPGAAAATDLQTAFRIREEFQLPHVILEEATEGHLAAEVIAAAGVPVVCGPAFDSTVRAIATGPGLEEMRLFASPPPICCEHTHEEFDGEEVHEEHEDHAVNGLALDLLLTLTPKGELAQGTVGRRFGEGNGATPALANHLQEAGIAFALGAAEAHDGGPTEGSLIPQARTAVRWGLPAELALPLITSRAAEICGMGETVRQRSPPATTPISSSGPGRRSSPLPVPLLVIVDGQVVLDDRSGS